MFTTSYRSQPKQSESPTAMLLRAHEGWQKISANLDRTRRLPT